MIETTQYSYPVRSLQSYFKDCTGDDFKLFKKVKLILEKPRTITALI